MGMSRTYLTIRKWVRTVSAGDWVRKRLSVADKTSIDNIVGVRAGQTSIIPSLPVLTIRGVARRLDSEIA